MNRLILLGILWCLAISIGRAQEPAEPKEASQTPTLAVEQTSPFLSEPTPVNGQPSPFRPARSEPPRRVTESKRIVIQPGVDAQESEVAMQFMADLEKVGIAKIDKTEMTPTSDSPIVVQFFMRENESFEKIKQFIVVLRHSGLEHMVLEYGGIHPEGRGEPENGLVFRTILGFSPDELQGLEKAARKAAEDCGLSLHFAGTVVAPSELATSGPPDKKPGDRDAEGYGPVPAAPQPVTQSVLPDSKTIVLVIDADAQKSEVVKEVIAALEKAGIATGQSAETAPPTNSPISVTLNMRKDESYDKIKQLIEALKNAGVQQISIREGGVQYQGKEINQLKVNRQPGYSPAEYEKIDLAAIAIMDQCGLSLLREVNWMPGKADERNPFDDANLPVSDSSERTNPAMDSGFIPKSSQTADLRTQYEAANKQAHDLAESLRQTPDPAKKSELRTAVQRAFTLRQSLLRAELQEMQARLEKTQQSLDMRDRMADQVVDRRVEDLLNPQLKWDDEDLIKTTSTITSTLTAPTKPKTAESTSAELEGDWHRVEASVDQTGAETPHFDVTIHGNTWTKFVDQKSEAVEFLCDTTKKTIEFKSTPPLVYTYEMHGDVFILLNETQSQAFNRGHRRQPDAVSELEGDWHQVSATDKDGKALTVRLVNMSFKKDQYTFAYQGGQNNRRVEVFADKKEIRYFQEGKYNDFVQDHYLLEGEQLTIYEENRRNVFQRGHVALPKSIPAATDEQKSLWRSGIVQIIIQQRQTASEPQGPNGYGVIVSPQGMIISQLKLSDGDWIFFARFDDGGVIPIKLVEEGIQGWGVFQPEQPIEVNHHYRLSAAAVGKDDEVNSWAMPGNHRTLDLYKNNVTALDRKSPALGLTVWQLHSNDMLDGTLPILDGNGDMLAITAIGTGDLSLAVPVAELKTMFPKSLGLLKDAEKPAVSR